MSWQALSWAGQRTVGHPLAKALLIIIADECNSVGVTFRGPKTLMARSELPKATYYAQMKILRDKGLITVIERRRPSGVKTSNFIVLACDPRGAWDYFEQLILDEQIDANPLLEDGSLRSSDPAKESLSGTQNGPAHGQHGPCAGLGESTTETDRSLSGTDPSRVTEPLGNQEAEPSEISHERDDPAAAICAPLLEHVRRIDPTAKPTSAWRAAARQIVEDDGRSVAEAVALIDWASADEFWSTLVLGPPDLRKHWTAITAARQRQAPQRGQRQRRLEALAATAGACCVEPGAPPAAAKQEWAALAVELREVFGSHFDMNLKHAHAHTGSEGELLLAVPEPVYGWVRDRMAPAIDRTAGRHIEIVVCQEATP